MIEEITYIKNLKTSYKIFGDGKPLLILHGWRSKSDSWAKTAEIISKQGYKVIIPDLPGFGKTDILKEIWDLDDYCNFVEEFINFLNLENFFLLGHSFGGSISVKIALKHPKKIKKLFLISSACIRSQTIDKYILSKIAKAFKWFSFLPFYPFLRKAFYKFAVGKSDYIYEKGAMQGTLIKIVKENLLFSLSSIETPTIIIWGDRDKITPLSNAYLIHEEINNSKLAVIPGGNHDLELKMPRFLAEKILENLKSHN